MNHAMPGAELYTAVRDAVDKGTDRAVSMQLSACAAVSAMHMASYSAAMRSKDYASAALALSNLAIVTGGFLHQVQASVGYLPSVRYQADLKKQMRGERGSAIDNG